MSHISAILRIDPQRYGRIPAACARYGWNRSGVYKLAGKGLIVLRKIGRTTYVDFESGDRLMASLPVAKIKPQRDPDTVAVAAEAPCMTTATPKSASDEHRQEVPVSVTATAPRASASKRRSTALPPAA